MCTEVLNLWSVREIFTSRKVTSEDEIVEVKDTEDEAFKEEMKVFSSSIPCGQRRKISSMYRSQRRGFSGCEERKVCSKRPRKRFA
jgi:hypothetical protein